MASVKIAVMGSVRFLVSKPRESTARRVKWIVSGEQRCTQAETLRAPELCLRYHPGIDTTGEDPGEKTRIVEGRYINPEGSSKTHF